MSEPESTWSVRFKQLVKRPTTTEPAFNPSSWSGALIVMCALAAVLWFIQIINATEDQGLDRFGLRPRRLDGLWGVLTQPFLHASYGHMLANTVPFILIGWVVLLAGLRSWLIVTTIAIVAGGFATWLIAPSGLVVGVSGLVFGWLGYLLGRAYFARTFKWIFVAIAVVFFFGTLLGGLLPTFNSQVSWQSHACGFAGGVLASAVLHPRRRRGAQRSSRGRGVS
ncbi:MAG: rhomboid family intramembrane serine protease [Jatrophihabitantaceae bacterium]